MSPTPFMATCELRFQPTGIEVMTVNKMRAELGSGWEKEEDVHKIIWEFLKQRQSRLQQGDLLQVKQSHDSKNVPT